MKKQKLSYQKLNSYQEKLAREYAELLGYKVIINNEKRKALIIDENDNAGFLVIHKGELNYYYKGVYEPITITMVQQIKIADKVSPKKRLMLPERIKKAIFGILDFNVRSLNNLVNV